MAGILARTGKVALRMFSCVVVAGFIPAICVARARLIQGLVVLGCYCDFFWLFLLNCCCSSSCRSQYLLPVAVVTSVDLVALADARLLYIVSLALLILFLALFLLVFFVLLYYVVFFFMRGQVETEHFGRTFRHLARGCMNDCMNERRID